jgi:hypothetical protein
MQGVYTYIPETHHVPKEYNVAATSILSLLFMVPISLAAALALMYYYYYYYYIGEQTPLMTTEFWQKYKHNILIHKWL